MTASFSTWIYSTSKLVFIGKVSVSGSLRLVINKEEPWEKHVQKELWDFSHSLLHTPKPCEWTLIVFWNWLYSDQMLKREQMPPNRKIKTNTTFPKKSPIPQMVFLTSLYLLKYVKAKNTFLDWAIFSYFINANEIDSPPPFFFIVHLWVVSCSI